jgi:hypothetical protein
VWIAPGPAAASDDAAAPISEVPALDAAAAQGLATITYMTASSVYIDAGSGDGLAAGDIVEVMRDGIVVASLRAEHLSTRKTSCTALSASVELQVGDQVRFVANLDDSPAEEAAAGSDTDATVSTSSGRTTSWLRSKGIRGRIGARYLAVIDRSGTDGQDFSQPALDLRVDGKNINEQPFDLSVDVRTRRTYRKPSDGGTTEEGSSRVYRAAASWHPRDSLFNLTVGRQFSPELPTISVFDGASATLRWTYMGLGLLSGTQPDAIDYGYSTQIREHGAFLQFTSSRPPVSRWYLTTGIIGSYDGGEINREYLHAQTSFSLRRLSLYVSQDLDFHRGWKQAAEGTPQSWTDTHASMRIRVTDGSSVHGGYDNRRNIRLYRDFESPETEFDDAYREGYWAGFSQRFRRALRMGFDARRSTGGFSGDADSYTATFNAQWRVHASLRGTYFQNQLASGWLRSGALGTQLGSSLSVELGGGARDDSSNPDGNTLGWMSFSLDYSLGRHWYLSMSTERSDDGVQANDQYYATTTYRF